MGGNCCCCDASSSLNKEKGNEIENLDIQRPKDGKKFQLLCIRGHEIVFYNKVKENIEALKDGSPSKAHNSSRLP